MGAKKWVAWVSLLVPMLAMACGHCEEDLVASVYDHGLVLRSQSLKQRIMYMAWDGPVARDDATARRLMQEASRATGVTPGSVRVSVQPAALSVAFNPAKTNRAQIEASLQNRLTKMHVMVLPLAERP
jgi:hypothetical protein